jgi:hypothetical protein
MLSSLSKFWVMIRIIPFPHIRIGTSQVVPDGRLRVTAR